MPSNSKSHRVIFTFDELSLAALREFAEVGGFSSLAEGVRESIQLARALQKQSLAGYDGIEVVNAKGKRRELVTKSLVRRGAT